MSEVSEWLLYNTPDDRRTWRNSEGLTPAQLAEKGNHVDLEKVARTYRIRYQMIRGKTHASVYEIRNRLLKALLHVS